MPDQLVRVTRPALGRRLALQIIVGALARFFISIARRFVYPFAPVFSRGLGVPLTAITSLIALNQSAGIFNYYGLNLNEGRGRLLKPLYNFQ
jgi:hypothetical protein